METKDILNQFLSELLEGVKAAGAFVNEQLPLVLQEYIVWGVAESFIWLLPFLAPFVWLQFQWKKAIAYDSKENNIGSDAMPVTVFVAIGSILLSIGVVYHLLDLVKPLVAPRVYLIEELSKLIH